MAQLPTNTNNDKTLLEGGGIPGALIGGLLGGASNVARGYATVAELRGAEQGMRHKENEEGRSQEAHEIQKIMNFQNIRSKAIDLQQKKANHKVFEIGQAGREAEAKLARDRAINLASHTKSFQNLDEMAIESQLIDTVTALTDKSVEFVASIADSPYIRSSRGFEFVKKRAEAAGIELPQMLLGGEWDPTTPAKFKAVASMAQSRRAIQAKIDTEERKHANAVELQILQEDSDMTQNQANIEQRDREALLNARAKIEKARLDNAAKSGNVTLGSLGYENFADNSEKVVQYASAIVPGWAGVTEELKQGSNSFKAAAWVNSRVERLLTVQARNYNADPVNNPLPLTYMEALEAYGEEMVGRIGLDGNFYEKDTAEYLNGKRRFIGSVKESVKQNKMPAVADAVEMIKARHAGTGMEEQKVEEYYERLWKNPTARGFATGSKAFMGTANPRVPNVTSKGL